MKFSNASPVCVGCGLLAAALLLGNPAADLAGTEEVRPSIESRVDDVFKELDRTDSPGCAMAVYRDGRIAYSRGYGMANLELGVRNSPSSIFDIGSTSKQFTAFCIHLLAREGKLSLDDDIRKYVPEIPSYGKPVTIRHLLHHTSGIRDYLELMWLEGIRDEDLTDDAQALDVIARQKALNFEPGVEHLYSNSGYFLLSVIVKRVSGRSLREFAEERIFIPLGMRHTQFNDQHTRIIPNRATGYGKQDDGSFGISMSDFEQTGDGAVLTSVEDLLLWDSNFYDPRVSDADLIAQMQVPGSLNDGKKLEYASGLGVGEYRGLKTVSHGGAWAGYRAELLRFPDEHLSVACLCNFASAAPWALAQQVAEIYFEEKMTKDALDAAAAPAAQPIEVPVAELQKLAGAYRNPVSRTIWMLAVEDGKLIANARGFEMELVPMGDGSFRAEGGPMPISVKTELPAAGSSGRPRLKVEPAGQPIATLDPIAEWTPSAQQLAAYAGTYTSEEIQTGFRFEIEGGRLHMRHRTLGGDPLVSYAPDEFSLGNITFSFARDSKKRITGFTLSLGRVKNIVFSRTGT